MNLKLLVAYDGTRYFGWQKTETGPSIEEALLKAFYTILRHEPLLDASSRTDRGVHAAGQVVLARVEGDVDPHRLYQALNGVLPDDISVLSVEPVEDSFHPSLNAVAKEYRYQLCMGVGQEPFHRLYSWHIHRPLNLTHMEEAARHLIGTHDFSAFTTEPKEDSIRTLHRITCIELGHQRLLLSLLGDRFLYKMARTLVGTLVYVGLGKLDPDSIHPLLTLRDRALAGATAPAHGLTLQKVFFQRDELPIVSGFYATK